MLAPDRGKLVQWVRSCNFSLDRAYTYFRSRAIDPTLIEDEYKQYRVDELPKGLAFASTFQDGKMLMQLNAEEAQETDTFEEFVGYFEHRQAMVDNMDY